MTLARHTPTRRPGLTLTEALVAMFVAAIGLIALMTLFPLGALQMAQAIKDERCEQTALQADGLIRFYWKSEVTDKRGRGHPGFPDGPDPMEFAFNRPIVNQFYVTAGPSNNPEVVDIYDTSVVNPATPYIGIYANFTRRPANSALPPLYPTPSGLGPGYPIVLDPLGWQARGGKAYSQAWVGGRPNNFQINGVPSAYTADTLPAPLPRRAPRSLFGVTPNAYNTGNTPPGSGPPWSMGATITSMYVSGSGLQLGPFLRFSTLLDDLTYDESGTGAPPADLNPSAAPTAAQIGNLGKVERQGRFNWLAVVQRTQHNDPDRPVKLTIAVFDGRAPGFAPDASELIYPRDSGIPTNAPLASQLQNIVVFVPGDTRVRVYYQGERPPISKGKWVLDGTIGGFPIAHTSGGSPAFDPDQAGAVWSANTGTPLTLRHANFYRVVSVTEGIDPDATRANLTYLDIDLEKPVEPRSDGGSAYYAGNLYVLPGLAEVFDRPPLTK